MLAVLFEKLAEILARVLGARGAAWLAAGWFSTGLDIAKPEWLTKVKKGVEAVGVDLAVKLAGLELDEGEPFSDASLCNAIGKRTGLALRTLKNRESMREDVEHWAMAKLEEKTGLHIRNIRDKQKTKKDLMKYVSPIVADATGLPLSDISDVDKTKEEVKNYLEDSALVHLSHDIAKTKTLVKEALESVGMSLDLLVEKIVKKGGIDPVTGQPNVKIDVEMVVLGVLSRALLKAEMRRREGEVVKNKDSRRAEQMRAALKRFRDKRGSRMTYERVT